MLNLKLIYFGHLMWRTESLKRPKWWERLRAGGERGDRGWDGWMALPTQWTWVWANSGRYWRTGKPGVLQFLGLQRVGYNLVLNNHNSAKVTAYIIFPNAQRTLFRLDHMSSHKKILKVKKMKSYQALFQPQWYETRNWLQEENWKKKKPHRFVVLNNMLLNNHGSKNK